MIPHEMSNPSVCQDRCAQGIDCILAGVNGTVGAGADRSVVDRCARNCSRFSSTSCGSRAMPKQSHSRRRMRSPTGFSPDD